MGSQAIASRNSWQAYLVRPNGRLGRRASGAVGSQTAGYGLLRFGAEASGGVLEAEGRCSEEALVPEPSNVL